MNNQSKTAYKSSSNENSYHDIALEAYEIVITRIKNNMISVISLLKS